MVNCTLKCEVLHENNYCIALAVSIISISIVRSHDHYLRFVAIQVSYRYQTYHADLAIEYLKDTINCGYLFR